MESSWHKWLREVRRWILSHPLFAAFIGAFCSIIFLSTQGVIVATFLVIWLLILFKLRKKIFAITLLASILFGSLHYLSLNRSQRVSELAISAENVEFKGIIEKSLQGGERIIKITESPQLPVGSRCLLSSYTYTNKGQIVSGRGWMSKIDSARNWTSFDKKKWLSTQGVTGMINGPVKIESRHWWSRINSFFEPIRGYVRNAITMGITDENSIVVICSMFLGDRFGNDSEVVGDFKSSGAMHVFAVSGMHVVLVTSAFFWIVRFIYLPRWLLVLMTICVAFFYTGLTGWGVPAVRASVMMSIFLVAPLLYRKSSILNSLAASSLLMFCFDTHQVFSAGFQLSYGVVLAIVLLTPFWKKRLEFINFQEPFLPPLMWSRRQRFMSYWRKKLNESLAVSISAWMGSSPLIAFYFKIFTPIGLLISVPVVVALFLVLCLCMVSLAVGGMSDYAGEKVNQLNATVAKYSHYLVKTAADVPYGNFAFSKTPSESIEILDMRSGASVYLNFDKGLLLDVGKEEYSKEVISSLELFKRGFKTIILSHDDKNHYSGLNKILEKREKVSIYTVSAEIEKVSSSSSNFSKTLEGAVNKGHKVVSADDEAIMNNQVEFLYDGSAAGASIKDDKGLVVRVEWRGKVFLFLNDAGFYAERTMLESEMKLDADVLVIGKHAEQASCSEAFINAVSPDVVIATEHSWMSESRDFLWKKRLEQYQIKLLLLSETGGVSITEKNGNLEFDCILH